MNKVTVDAADADGTATGWLTLYSVEDKDDMSDASHVGQSFVDRFGSRGSTRTCLVSAPLVLCWSQMAAVVHTRGF